MDRQHVQNHTLLGHSSTAIIAGRAVVLGQPSRLRPHCSELLKLEYFYNSENNTLRLFSATPLFFFSENSLRGEENTRKIGRKKIFVYDNMIHITKSKSYISEWKPLSRGLSYYILVEHGLSYGRFKLVDVLFCLLSKQEKLNVALILKLKNLFDEK
jgi:hypothetical protein